MSGYVLSADADEDLQAIYLYSEETWGEAQARTYLTALYRVFDRLGDHPGMGRMRPELGPRIRRFPHGQHLVVYMEWGDELAIVRVLHGRMDIESAFANYDPELGLTRRRSP